MPLKCNIINYVRSKLLVLCVIMEGVLTICPNTHTHAPLIYPKAYKLTSLTFYKCTFYGLERHLGVSFVSWHIELLGTDIIGQLLGVYWHWTNIKIIIIIYKINMSNITISHGINNIVSLYKQIPSELSSEPLFVWIYGITTKEHSPYWYDEQITIDSHHIVWSCVSNLVTLFVSIHANYMSCIL